MRPTGEGEAGSLRRAEAWRGGGDGACPLTPLEAGEGMVRVRWLGRSCLTRSIHQTRWALDVGGMGLGWGWSPESPGRGRKPSKGAFQPDPSTLLPGGSPPERVKVRTPSRGAQRGWEGAGRGVENGHPIRSTRSPPQGKGKRVVQSDSQKRERPGPPLRWGPGRERAGGHPWVLLGLQGVVQEQPQVVHEMGGHWFGGSFQSDLGTVKLGAGKTSKQEGGQLGRQLRCVTVQGGCHLVAGGGVVVKASGELRRAQDPILRSHSLSEPTGKREKAEQT